MSDIFSRTRELENEAIDRLLEAAIYGLQQANEVLEKLFAKDPHESI